MSETKIHIRFGYIRFISGNTRPTVANPVRCQFAMQMQFICNLFQPLIYNTDAGNMTGKQYRYTF